ncbi:hypothetical protein ElyMa_000491400 [Elysia marginata]|uniref:Uncharacterized protein n=1 Tax=Elysia marginata TaxID=1093978 RepID=A0AAV4FTH3_9GAST|nr:hypothetical protein ElyMa_000491400 [Elysia marginata]
MLRYANASHPLSLVSNQPLKSTRKKIKSSSTSRHLGSRDYPIYAKLSRVTGSSCDWLARDAGRRPGNWKDDIPLTCQMTKLSSDRGL